MHTVYVIVHDFLGASGDLFGEHRYVRSQPDMITQVDETGVVSYTNPAVDWLRAGGAVMNGLTLRAISATSSTLTADRAWKTTVYLVSRARHDFVPNPVQTA